MSVLIGKQILDIKTKPKRAIIDNLLYEKDFSMLVAAPKVGKSILAQQIAMSVAGGDYCLDLPVNPEMRGSVVYFQAEGDPGEMQQRYVDMNKAVKTEMENIMHYCRPGIKLNTPEGMADFTATIDANHFFPNLIVIDPLYMAFVGDLKCQVATSSICDAIDHLRNMYDCAVLVVHHTSKETYNYKGEAVDRGDGASFGSAFLKAFVDSMFMLRVKMERRYLTCDTQRSGRILDSLEFDLIAPTQDPNNPLCFVKPDLLGGSTQCSLMTLFADLNKPRSTDEIAEILGKHRNSVGKELARYKKKGLIGEIRKGKFIKYYWKEYDIDSKREDRKSKSNDSI